MGSPTLPLLFFLLKADTHIPSPCSLKLIFLLHFKYHFLSEGFPDPKITLTHLYSLHTPFTISSYQFVITCFSDYFINAYLSPRGFNSTGRSCVSCTFPFTFNALHNAWHLEHSQYLTGWISLWMVNLLLLYSVFHI